MEDLEITGEAPFENGHDLEAEIPAKMSLEEIISKASKGELNKEAPSNSAQRERNQDGTFKGKEPIASEANVIEAKEKEVLKAPQEEIKPPLSWRENEKQIFKTLPVDVQREIARREDERERKFHEITTTTSAARKKYAELDDLFTPYERELALTRTTPAQVVRQLMAEREIIANDPKSAIIAIAQNAGIDLAELTEGNNNSPAYNPQILALQNQIKELQGFIQQQQESAQLSQRSAVESFVDSFANAKDEQGNLKHPYFNDVETEITPIAQMLRRQNPHASNEEILREAYDRAVYANPTVRQKLLNQENAKRLEEKRAAASQAKIAASTLNGAPIPSATQVVDSKKLGLEGIIRKAMSGEI